MKFSRQILGEKLLGMLRANGGDTLKLEVEVKRWKKETVDEDTGGGWYTEAKLKQMYHYTQSFVCTLDMISIP